MKKLNMIKSSGGALLLPILILVALACVPTISAAASSDPLWIFSPRQVPITNSSGVTRYINATPMRTYSGADQIPLNVVTDNGVAKILWTLYRMNNDQTVTRVPGVGGTLPSTNGRARNNVKFVNSLVPSIPDGRYQIKVCTLGQVFCEMSAPVKIVNPQ